MSRTVLLVDDDRESVEALVVYLQYHRLQAITAQDGEQALSLLRGGLAPGVIVLDLMMPGTDGFAFRSAQLAEPQLATIPVIVCSAAYDASGAAERLRAAAFVQKPVEPQTLLRLIEQYCGEPPQSGA